MFNFFSKKHSQQPLFFTTDIHCHILPGIDDGAKDLETAVTLVEKMAELGFKRIFASPHITYGTFENNADTIGQAFDTLSRAVKERGVDIELGYSAENRLDDLFMNNLKDGALLTLPGNIVLVENSYFQEPWGLDSLLFDLQVKGYRPVMVHPERYPYYFGNKKRYDELHKNGTAFQVNLLSLAGYYGKGEKKMAEYLIDRGLVDFIGTDIHRLSHVEYIRNYLASKDYRQHRAALSGKLLNDNLCAV